MKGTILLSLILGVLFAVLTLIVGLMLWPSYAVVSAVLAFVLVSRTGVEPNCPSVMHFRIFRQSSPCKICILLRFALTKSIKNAFADGCEQF